VTREVFDHAQTALRKLDSQVHESALAPQPPSPDKHRDPLATATRGH
jgi:hypothetical protein